MDQIQLEEEEVEELYGHFVYKYILLSMFIWGHWEDMDVNYPKLKIPPTQSLSGVANSRNEFEYKELWKETYNNVLVNQYCYFCWDIIKYDPLS